MFSPVITQIGTSSPSIETEVDKVEEFIKDSGFKYDLDERNSMTIEGPWDNVMNFIGQVHLLLHDNGVVRLHSNIRVGTDL
ncbi:hypothetical protein WICPIJ_006043 [Wickerhamomyces pijperi]|uniref:Thiamine-binding protein domain-containing protein n=1 Tax=Wickerhamomyces pijperi TaxID=599730 RepID=A0A9P8TKJ7_WICPI|nr:hypothetical protein WICPIJ_006043 [Wickerhamomyces pijperi]